jgi:hypothetical protein
MKGFFFLSGVVLSVGRFILVSLFLRRLCWLLLDRREVCSNDLCARSILPFRCLPESLIEFTDDHYLLAPLEEVKVKLSQFSNGHDVDPISTSLTRQAP